MIKKLKDSLISMRRNVLEYIITNRLFISYVLLALISTLAVRGLTIGKTFRFNPFVTDLGLILIIGGLGYFIRPKNQFKYYFAWTIFFNLICLISSIYYRFFTNFASIGDFATLGQTETVTGSIFERLNIFDGVYILLPILFYLIHKKLLSSAYYYFVDKIEKGKKMVVTTILVGVFCVAYSFGVASGTDYSRLAKQWNRAYNVERFGILLYQANDIVQFLRPKINSLFGMEEAKAAFDEYFSQKEFTKKNKYTNILNGKNIIFVHMESIQDFLMDLEFNGEEVTPNLNKLAKEGMFFENFYPQVSTGTSSDTEFTLLTGLLPAASGSVFVSYYDRNYQTIPKFLKEKSYYTFSMHGNLSSMWNRNRVHPLLGYDGMYFRESFTYSEDEVINLGVNDKVFFAQAINHLENIEATYPNYFGTIITLSNHSPFNLASKHSTLDLTTHYTKTSEDGEITQIDKDYLSDTKVGEYIKSANYADSALGEFIDSIKKSSAFKNTVFVFYGDHDAKLSEEEINILYNLNPETGEPYKKNDENYQKYDYFDHELNKKTPLIIWSKNKELSSIFKGKVSYTTGMYNVAATILNMYGIKTKYTMGEDIFSVKDNNVLVFPNGNVLSKKLYYNNSTEEFKDFVNDKTGVLKKLKDSDELKQEIIDLSKMAEKKLEISNSIIVYDLLDTLDKDGE